jgi:PAS domain S-box-containing protein
MLSQPAVLAQAPGGDVEATTRMTIVLLTIVAASVIGISLYEFSRRSAHVPFKQEEDKQSVKALQGSGLPADLTMSFLKELNQLALPPGQRRQVARSVSDIVKKGIDERVEVIRKEIDEEYGQVIEKQRQAGAALQSQYQEALVEKKQTVAVLGSIAEGLVVVNNAGQVVMMNPAAEKLLSVDQRDRIGKPLLETLRDEHLAAFVQGSSNADQEIVLTAKQDSTKRVLRASNAMITDEDGKTVGMVAVLSDVTKQRELDQLKSEFVSKVSHELRTPIVAMQHALSILSDRVAGPLSEEQGKFVTLTQRNLQRLNGLINDLLDLSKLEAKKIDLHLEPASIAEIIQTVCDSLDAWAQSKLLTISRRVPGNLPKVTCDAARITQVVTNLLGNAIKFTPKQGRIIVEARLAPDDMALEVSVTDLGMGIAKDDLPKLFNKFQQVGERTATDVSGTGLGLAISKEIVELHHGRIWAESDPVKKGARFAFTLLLEPAPAQHQRV